MQAMSNKGFRKFLIVLSVFIVISIIFYFISPNLSLPFYKGSFKDYIAVLYIQDTISEAESNAFTSSRYNHNYILNQINAFMNDDKNKALVIFVDSPGGGIYETDELYLKLMEYKEKKEAPIYVSMGSIAASGGYYISAAGNKIYINRNTITGSIGVTMGTFYDVSGFLEKHGIKTVTMTAGRNKAMGDITTPMTQEQKDIIQSLLNESYEQFVDIIVQGRGIAKETVRNIADGRLYSAKQAVDLNLVDEIGTLDDAIQGIRNDYGLNDCEVYYYWYEDKSFLSSLLNGFSNISQKYSQGDIGMVLQLLEKNEQVPISYLLKLN
ncbi:MAG: signal peptide peptidase SppA [Clostridiales bacterium]|nr:signal peptide peptidase SppA [Clostridiales bacterium]